MKNLIATIVASLAILIVLAPASEAGLFRRRRARLQCVPQPAPTRGATVEILATSISRSALGVHNDPAIGAATRNALLTEFESQIGPVARNAAILTAILADDFVSRDEVFANILGEVRDISNELATN